MLLLTAIALTLATDPAVLPVRGDFHVDPVRLIEHAEHAAGQDDLTAEHEGLRYHFADQHSRAEFLKNPGRYAAQLGGACARMGPLSGSCRTDIYAVVEGRMYVFASEACRTTFLKHHARLLESDDAPIDTPTPESAAAAKEVLDLAVSRATDGKGFAAFRSYEFGSTTSTESNGTTWVNTQRTIVTLNPLEWESHDQWNDRDWAQHWTDSSARFIDPDATVLPMVPAQADAMRRKVHRQPLVMLARYERGEALAESLGDENDARRVRLHAGGVTMELLIHRTTGDLLASACRARDAALMLGRLELRYTPTTEPAPETHGLRIPTAAEATFDHQRNPDLDRTASTASATLN